MLVYFLFSRTEVAKEAKEVARKQARANKHLIGAFTHSAPEVHAYKKANA